jgi:iron(III) transport system substrate-binding protein
LLVGALAALLAGSACSNGNTPDAEPSDAASTGALTIYSGREEELVGPLIKNFEKASGLKVDVRFGETAELANQIIEEGDNSPADLFWSQDAGALGAIAKEGLFADLPDATLDLVPARFRSPEGKWVGTSGRARVLVYNKQRVQSSELPDSVLDLTDPAWNGKVGWAPTNGSFQSFVTALRKVEGEDAATKWLKDMVANDTQTYDANSAIVTAVANGEIEAGLVNHYYVLEMGSEDATLSDKVANHFFEGGDVGSLVNAAGVGIIDGAKNAANAQRFVDFLLSREGEEYFDEEVYEYPLAGDLPAPKGVPALDDIKQPDVDLSDLDDLQGTLDLLRKTDAL